MPSMVRLFTSSAPWVHQASVMGGPLPGADAAGAAVEAAAVDGAAAGAAVGAAVEVPLGKAVAAGAAGGPELHAAVSTAPAAANPATKDRRLTRRSTDDPPLNLAASLASRGR